MSKVSNTKADSVRLNLTKAERRVFAYLPIRDVDLILRWAESEKRTLALQLSHWLQGSEEYAALIERLGEEFGDEA